MPHTVIGLFDALPIAQKVEKALQEADFEYGRTLLVGSDASQALHSDESTDGKPVGLTNSDITDTLVEHGVPRDRAEFYAEGIQRGGAAVLLVDLDEAAAERAAAILRRQRPLDPSRRLEAFHEHGHGGYAPVANPFVEGEPIPEVARLGDDHYGDEVAVIYVM
jgi:hypothetical protein